MKVTEEGCWECSRGLFSNITLLLASEVTEENQGRL
jgi:hypothetical protein